MTKSRGERRYRTERKKKSRICEIRDILGHYYEDWMKEEDSFLKKMLKVSGSHHPYKGQSEKDPYWIGNKKKKKDLNRDFSDGD